MDINAELKAILANSTLLLSWDSSDGTTYPYESYEHFAIVDGDSGRMDVIATGNTLEELVENFRKKMAQ